MTAMRQVSPRGRITYFSRSDPHAVYRIFDRYGRVIYIGSSYDPGARIQTHRDEKPWRPEISRWTEEWLLDWRAANRAEHAAIWREDPDHNFVGTALSAIVSRVRPWTGEPEAVAIVARARAFRAERIAAEKAGDFTHARLANLRYAQIAAQLGLHHNRVQQIVEGRSAGGQGGPGGGKAAAE